MQYLLTFRSLTYAQQGARVLERTGISCAIVRIPKEISSRGCSYGLSVPERHIYNAKAGLQKSGFMPERIFSRRDEEWLEESGI